MNGAAEIYLALPCFETRRSPHVHLSTSLWVLLVLFSSSFSLKNKKKRRKMALKDDAGIVETGVKH